MYVGQGISDPNGFWQVEFWNRVDPVGLGHGRDRARPGRA